MSDLDPRRLELELEELIHRSSLAVQQKGRITCTTQNGSQLSAREAGSSFSSKSISKPVQAPCHGGAPPGIIYRKCGNNQGKIQITVAVKKEPNVTTTNNHDKHLSRAAAGATSASVPVPVAQPSPEERVRAFIKEHQNQRTSKAYATGWAGFASYLTKASVAEDAITPAHIADYLTSRWRDQGKSASTICSDRAAIAHRLKQLNKHKLMEDRLVVDSMNLVRQKASQSKPKRHMSAELMTELIRHHDSEIGSMKTSIGVWRAERNICLMLFMMVGMLRESEAASLKATDVEIRQEYVKGVERELVALSISQSKTDQAGIGAVVLLDSDETNPSHCPVSRVKRYIKATQAAGMSDKEPMFPTEQGTFMKPSTPCGIIQRAIQAVNDEWTVSSGREFYWGNPKEYGSHSMRRGGVTTARGNGVSMLDIQRHGRWKGLSVFDYVGISTEDKLAVSNNFLAVASVGAPVLVPVPDRVPAKDSTIPNKSNHWLSQASVNKSSKPRKRKMVPTQGDGVSGEAGRRVVHDQTTSGTSESGSSSRGGDHGTVSEQTKKKAKIKHLLRGLPGGDRNASISSLHHKCATNTTTGSTVGLSTATNRPSTVQHHSKALQPALSIQCWP